MEVTAGLLLLLDLLPSQARPEARQKAGMLETSVLAA